LVFGFPSPNGGIWSLECRKKRGVCHSPFQFYHTLSSQSAETRMVTGFFRQRLCKPAVSVPPGVGEFRRQSPSAHGEVLEAHLQRGRVGLDAIVVVFGARAREAKGLSSVPGLALLPCLATKKFARVSPILFLHDRDAVLLCGLTARPVINSRGDPTWSPLLLGNPPGRIATTINKVFWGRASVKPAGGKQEGFSSGVYPP
jgi:hypothetical protein